MGGDAGNTDRIRSNLLEQRVEVGHVLITLQDDRDRTGARDHTPEQAEDRVGDVGPVCVDDHRALRARRARLAEPPLVDRVPLVPGDVDLHDAIERRVAHPRLDVEPEVLGVDVGVVDVEHQAAVRRLAHAREHLPLAHLGAARVPVEAHVLDGERHAKHIAGGADTVGDPLHRGGLERHGERDRGARARPRTEARWSECQGEPTPRTNAARSLRYAPSRGSTPPIDIVRPCVRIGYVPASSASAARGWPPRSM